MKAGHSGKSHRKQWGATAGGAASELTAGSTTKDDSDYFPSLKKCTAK